MQTTIDMVKLMFLMRLSRKGTNLDLSHRVSYLQLRPGVNFNREFQARQLELTMPDGPSPDKDERPVLPIWKRTLDLLILLALLPLTVPVGLLVALIVKCGSRGPVLFFQERIGYQGRRFRFFKFRTMRAAAECDLHRKHTMELIRSGVPMTKLDQKNDPRLVPFGAVLRASGLDELPQLINVLFGEMTIVGPRPCVPYEYELYEPEQLERFEAVPGLTGLWQVSGKNRTTFRRMVELDIEYHKHCSLWLDLTIIGKTLPVLFGQCRDLFRQKHPRPETVLKDSFLTAVDHL